MISRIVGWVPAHPVGSLWLLNAAGATLIVALHVRVWRRSR
jgi:hypothetical protein